MKDLIPGNHIYVWRMSTRQGMPIPPYQHHAILADDTTVITYTGEPGWVEADVAEISRVPLDVFTRGARIRVQRHRGGYAPAETLGRAESRLGETNYGLLTRNCEHFATWCATGQWRSRQVERGQLLLVVMFLAAGPALKALGRGRGKA
jgi:hypothetical protein